MKILKIFYSKGTDSLDIWIDEPEEEKMAREIDEEIIAKLDSEGDVIGLEITSLSTLSKKPLVIPIKAQGN